jgi:hypothetical protein
MQKRGAEINTLNLYKVTNILDSIISNIDQKIDQEKTRLSKSTSSFDNNLGAFLKHPENLGTHVDLAHRQKHNSMLYKAFEKVRIEQTYKESNKRLKILFQKRQRNISILKSMLESNKINEFIHVSYYHHNQTFM